LRVAARLRARCGVYAVVGMALLAACGDHRAPAITSQRWNDLLVQVQTQPDPPQPGANEVLVILGAPRGVPTYDCIVSLRTGDSDDWVQAIQDGHSGVYRRVVGLDPGGRSTLQVRIERHGDQTVLRFPALPALR
jgi:hypothetical protein